MSSFLQAIESRLAAILEGTLDRLLYPGVSRSLSFQLLELIDEKLRPVSPQGGLAPDLVTLWVSPERWDAWQSSRPVLDEVMLELETVYTVQGYKFRVHPRMQIFQDPDLRVEDIRIDVDYSRPDPVTSRTSVQKVFKYGDPAALPRDAYLVINGKQYLALDKPILNLGRASHNDIVINDPLVSREHLQLRGEHGHFLVFDLSSTGGTQVNNRPCTSAILKPGDVIRVGQTILIYNQEHAPIAGTAVIGPGAQGGPA